MRPAAQGGGLIRAVCNYDHLDDAWFEGKSEILPELLGRTHFLNRRHDFKTDDYARLQETYRLVHGPRGY